MRKGRRNALACAVGPTSELSVCAGREVMAQGVRSILDYSENEVRLRLCDMTLGVRGQGLTMKSYYNGAVCVSGEITELGFER